MPTSSKPEPNEDLTAEAVVPAAICSASEEVRRMVFAFDDHARQQEIRRIAGRVKALEMDLCASRGRGPVMSLPDSSGWWWNRHLGDTDPVCVEVHLWHRADGSVRGGSVSYGKSIHTLAAWQQRGEAPEWVKATVPWPNDEMTSPHNERNPPMSDPAAIPKPESPDPAMTGRDRRPSFCSPSGVEADVCADIAERQQKGIATYGVTVADNPLPLKEWLQHAYEETLDKAIYLKRAILEMENDSSAGTGASGPRLNGQ